MKLMLNKKLAWRIIEGKAYVLNPEKSELHRFDEISTAVWTLISRGAEFETICRKISGEYEVDMGTLRKDINEIVEEMRKKSLLED